MRESLSRQEELPKHTLHTTLGLAFLAMRGRVPNGEVTPDSMLTGQGTPLQRGDRLTGLSFFLCEVFLFVSPQSLCFVFGEICTSFFQFFGSNFLLSSAENFALLYRFDTDYLISLENQIPEASI